MCAQLRSCPQSELWSTIREFEDRIIPTLPLMHAVFCVTTVAFSLIFLILFYFSVSCASDDFKARILGWMSEKLSKNVWKEPSLYMIALKKERRSLLTNKENWHVTSSMISTSGSHARANTLSWLVQHLCPPLWRPHILNLSVSLSNNTHWRGIFCPSSSSRNFPDSHPCFYPSHSG